MRLHDLEVWRDQRCARREEQSGRLAEEYCEIDRATFDRFGDLLILPPDRIAAWLKSD